MDRRSPYGGDERPPAPAPFLHQLLGTASAHRASLTSTKSARTPEFYNTRHNTDIGPTEDSSWSPSSLRETYPGTAHVASFSGGAPVQQMSMQPAIHGFSASSSGRALDDSRDYALGRRLDARRPIVARDPTGASPHPVAGPAPTRGNLYDDDDGADVARSYVSQYSRQVPSSVLSRLPDPVQTTHSASHATQLRRIGVDRSSHPPAYDPPPDAYASNVRAQQDQQEQAKSFIPVQQSSAQPIAPSMAPQSKEEEMETTPPASPKVSPKIPQKSSPKRKKAKKAKKKAPSPKPVDTEPHERIPLSQMTLTSTKDETAAKKLLRNATDLADVLDKPAVHWLAETSWIFTLEQLTHVLSNDFERLREKLAHSALIRSDDAMSVDGEENGEVKSSKTQPEEVGLPPPSVARMPQPDKEPENDNSVDSDTKSVAPIQSSEQGGEEEDRLGSSDTHVPSDSKPKLGETTDDSEISFKSKPSDAVVVKGQTEGDSKPGVHVEEKTTKPDAISVSNDHGEPSPETLSKVNHLLAEWKRKVEEHVADDNADLDKKLFLGGALEILVPSLVRLFLETIRCNTAYDFLCLKKTESSSTIQIYRDWRAHCGLQSMKGFVLARHLLGIANRMENALSVPPVSGDDRAWMSTSLIVLTGSAREFILNELGIRDVNTFISERTKVWSDRLVSWREAQMMPALKGSGKVAMVSGWKTTLKESLDCEAGEGKVLTEAELARNPPIEPAPEGPTFKLKGTPKPERAKIISDFKDADSALASPDFLAATLRPDNIKFLNSVGIKNASELIEAEKGLGNDIIAELVKHRTEATGSQAQPATCVRLLYDWTQRVRSKIGELQESEPTLVRLAKKRGPKPKDLDSSEKDSGDNNSKSSNSKESKSAATTGKKRGPKQKTKQKDAKQRDKITSEEDLLNVLSAITRGFLTSVNINTARELLGTKTSNLSKWYIDYREREGMTALKGYGAIATVSGWKTQIRKAANELGLQDLSATPIQEEAGPVYRAPAAAEKSALLTTGAEYSSHINLLLGLSSHRFDVKDCVDPDAIYRFRLTVRNPLSSGTTKTSAEPCVYLTFLGAHSTSEAMRRKTEAPKTESGAPDGALPILMERSINPSDAEIYRFKEDGIFFSSTMTGGGLIDIGKYAIGPVIGNMNYSDLQERIRLFFSLSGRSYPPAASQRGIEGPWNVFPRKTNDGEQYLLHVEHPIEKGQVIALRRATKLLPELPSYIALEEDATLQERLTISRSISMLSPGYLKLMYDTISHIQSESVIRVLNKYDGTTLQDVPVDEAVLLTTTRRRVQWLSTRILNQLNEIQGRLQRENQRQPKGLTVSKDVVETLLLEPANVRALRQRNYQHWEAVSQALEKEVKDEVLACLGTAGSLRMPFDRRVWCKLSRDLLNDCARSVAVFACGNGVDPVGAQRRVVKEFCTLLKDAARALLNAKQDLGRLSLVPHPSEQETFQNGNSNDDSSSASAKSEDKNDEVVAIDGAEVGSVVFETVADVMAEDEDVNIAWYIENQLMNCVHAVAMSGYVKWIVDPLTKSEPIYDKRHLEDAVAEGLGQRIDRSTLTKSIRHRIAAITSVDKKEFPSAPPLKHAEPSSLPFFLGIVWPTLRSHGWHVDAGLNPTDVIYVPPGQKLSRAKRALQRYAKKRQERGRKRRLVEQQVLSVGLGNVPKLTKRLVVLSADDTLDAEKPKSVREALNVFEEKLREQFTEEDTDSKAKLGTVIGILRKYIAELLPFLEEKDRDNDAMETDEDALDATGSQKLMQLMTMLPGLLDQAGLPPQQIDTSMYMVKELLGFFTKHPVMPVTSEDYTDPPSVYNPFLAKKIKAITQGKGENVETEASDPNAGNPLSEIVMPEDEKLITPFAATALKQFIPCRATAADKRRGKPVPLGHPGFECRHCHATTGEGKFFFTGFDSLQTAAGVTWSHLTRCTMLDEELRLDLKKKREKHQAQRKALPYGSQSIFFRALWKRLNSSTFSASGRSVVLSSKVEASAFKNDSTGGDTKKGPNLLEFDNHIDVMLYIQKTELWKQKIDVREKIALYYSCLSEGGAIFNSSNLMTKHFSSEWILREKTKMGPIAEQQMLKRQLSTG